MPDADIENRETILIVDDEPKVASFLARMLKKKGYHVDFARDGVEAAEKIENHAFDLIISDIAMPRMDGYELFQHLKQKYGVCPCPFIFISAHTDSTEQIKGFQMGANDYLTKPFVMERLYASVENVLAKAANKSAADENIDLSGDLSKIRLEEIAQLAELTQMTGEMRITKDEMIIGNILFKDGELVDAGTPSLQGEEAFYDLFAADSGSFQFISRQAEDIDGAITTPMMSILFEASRLSDEGKLLYEKIDDLEAVLAIHSNDIPDELADRVAPQHLTRILKLIENRPSVRDIINNSGLSRARTETILYDLLESQMISIQAA